MTTSFQKRIIKSVIQDWILEDEGELTCSHIHYSEINIYINESWGCEASRCTNSVTGIYYFSCKDSFMCLADHPECEKMFVVDKISEKELPPTLKNSLRRVAKTQKSETFTFKKNSKFLLN